MSEEDAKLNKRGRGRPAKTKSGMDSSLTFKLPHELLEAAQAKSKNTGIAVSFILRRALEVWVMEV